MVYADTKRIEMLEADEVFDAMKRAIEKSEQFTVKKADKTSGQLYVTSGINWKSFGEQIYISIQNEIGGYSSVYIKSELKWGLVDYGRNYENLILLFQMLQKELGQ